MLARVSLRQQYRGTGPTCVGYGGNVPFVALEAEADPR
jgi:hypothetical protein